MKILLTLLTTLLINSVYADVWKTKNDWSEEYEEKYQNWIKNDGFHKRIFSDPTSPYYGVPTDCADIIYAARIIFSFENKLPFKVLNPAKKGIFSAKYISNTGNYFNNIDSEIDRVKAFISKLSVHSGTTILAQTDTYPIAISDIKSGDVYITKANGIRHAYLIKSISDSGIFDLYYSTVPRVVREIKFHRGLPLFTFENAPWGFRRFKRPDQLTLKESEIKDFSNEQYELLNKIGSSSILEYISDMLRTEDESIEGRLDRVISNICRSMDDRVDAIKKAEVFVREKLKGQCVNKSEYDNYSTPGLDNRIYKQISTLQKFYSKIKEANIQLNISSERYIALEELINNETSQTKLCEDSLAPITITKYFKRYKAKKLSSHPNDTESVRWGESEDKTDCKLFNN